MGNSTSNSDSEDETEYSKVTQKYTVWIISSIIFVHFVSSFNGNASNFVMHKTSSLLALRFSRVGFRSSSIRTFATLVSVQTSIFTTDRDLSRDAFQPSKYSFSGVYILTLLSPQVLVTIHVNILSMHKHVQGRTPFLPPLASSRVCFLNSF